MKSVLKPVVLVIIMNVMAINLAALRQQSEGTSKVSLAYELYSWQNSDNEWNFSVLPNTSSQKTVAQVFSKKARLRGINPLKQKISRLPEGTEIFWLDKLPAAPGPKAKGSESLRYPPDRIADDIKHYAEAHKITIKILPGKK
jgi:hypothetical protein